MFVSCGWPRRLGRTLVGVGLWWSGGYCCKNSFPPFEAGHVLNDAGAKPDRLTVIAVDLDEIAKGECILNARCSSDRGGAFVLSSAF